MADQLVVLPGMRVLALDTDGPQLRTEQHVLDLFDTMLQHNATMLAIPVERLDPGFFTLSTGIAGAILQKLTGYRIRVAVVGDISAQLAASESLQALVRECNRTRDVWFVADLAQLGERLAPKAG